jgi:hypothetical protein
LDSLSDGLYDGRVEVTQVDGLNPAIMPLVWMDIMRIERTGLSLELSKIALLTASRRRTQRSQTSRPVGRSKRGSGHRNNMDCSRAEERALDVCHCALQAALRLSMLGASFERVR